MTDQFRVISERIAEQREAARRAIQRLETSCDAREQRLVMRALAALAESEIERAFLAFRTW